MEKTSTKTYLLNAFSLNMLPEFAQVEIMPISLAEAMIAFKEEAPESAVGHAETAAILSGLLGAPVPFNRATVKLNIGDAAIVAQYIGPRLPEGATSLPDGAKIEFRWVRILPSGRQEMARWLSKVTAGLAIDY